MRSEAFGVSLVEGAMIGRPLISAEIGTGTTYVNSHEQSGIVVRPGDVDQLRAAMQRLYANEGLASRLGVGARSRYEALFTGAQMGNSYNAVYQELLGS
jgi:rhamnosyl/mannosyltransferase